MIKDIKVMIKHRIDLKEQNPRNTAPLSLRYLTADTLYNIPHPPSCILVKSKPSELLTRFKQIL